MDKFSGCGIVAAVFSAIATLIILTTGSCVPYGNVGVVTTWGSIEKGSRQPGLNFVFPVAQRIEHVNVQVQPHPFKEIEAASKEMQNVLLTGMMNFHLRPEYADIMLQTVGKDFASKIIDPAFNDYIKEIVPKFAATDVLTSRDKIRDLAKSKLQENLERYGIVVDDIYISNISFSPGYQAAIEAKQTAQQNVEREYQVLEQKRKQAEQKVVDAQGEGDALFAKAKKQAEANDVLNRSITPILVQYENTKKWNGELPQVTGGSIPLVNLGDK